jgi:hypothetical protein
VNERELKIALSGMLTAAAIGTFNDLQLERLLGVWTAEVKLALGTTQVSRAWASRALAEALTLMGSSTAQESLRRVAARLVAILAARPDEN